MQSSERNSLFRGLAVVAVAALLLPGCNESSPTEPKTATPTPVPTPIFWDNTVHLIAKTTGPDNCLGEGGNVGQVFQTTFALVRTGNVVTFIPPDPVDDYTYSGTVDGANFTATSGTVDAKFLPCGHGRFVPTLSGRFSEDGSHLTATEVLSSTFDSGQVWAYTYTWSASRR